MAASPVPKINTPELHQIDELLAAGDYQQARALFQEGKKGLPGPLPADSGLDMPCALNSTATSNWHSISTESWPCDVEDRNLQRFAKISQGRLLYAMSEFGQAESILYELALATGDGSSQREQEAIWHLLAHAAADRLQSSTEQPDLLDTATLATGSRDWFRPLLVPELNTTSPETSTHEPAEEVVFENWKVEADATQASGKVWTRQVEVTKILDTLINTLRRAWQLLPHGQGNLTGRTLHIHVNNIAASLCSTPSFPTGTNLGIGTIGRTTHQRHEGTDADARNAQYEERAERVALRAITQYSGSAGTTHFQVQIGNIGVCARSVLRELQLSIASYWPNVRRWLCGRPLVQFGQDALFSVRMGPGPRRVSACGRRIARSRARIDCYLWLARMEQEALAFDKAENAFWCVPSPWPR